MRFYVLLKPSVLIGFCWHCSLHQGKRRVLSHYFLIEVDIQASPLGLHWTGELLFYWKVMGFLTLQVVSTDAAVCVGGVGVGVGVGGRWPRFRQVIMIILTLLSFLWHHNKGKERRLGHLITTHWGFKSRLPVWSLLKPFQWDCRGLHYILMRVDVYAPLSLCWYEWAWAMVSFLFFCYTVINFVKLLFWSC